MPLSPSNARVPRRILIYSVNYAPELTGIGRFTGELAESLGAAGVACTVVTTPPHYPQWRVESPFRNRYGRKRAGTVEVFRCPVFIARVIRGITRLLVPISFALTSGPVVFWLILRRRPDIVLCIEPTLFAAPVALLASRLAGCRTVLHVQDLEIDGALEVGHLPRGGLIERLAHRFDRMVLRRFDHIVTISRAMAGRLSAKGVPADRVSLIRNWVDTDAIHPTGDSSYRRRLGVADHAFLVLYAGSIGAKQGIDLLCEAMATLGPDTGLVLALVGEGPAKAGLLERFGHLPQIRFHGLQPEPALNALLNAADLHVIPQLPDATDFALPSKLGGILASGRPLLVLGHPDQELTMFVRDVADVAEPGEPAAIAAELLRVARQGSSGAAENRVTLAAELSKARSMSKFRALFDQMLSDDTRSAARALGEQE